MLYKVLQVYLLKNLELRLKKYFAKLIIYEVILMKSSHSCSIEGLSGGKRQAKLNSLINAENVSKKTLNISFKTNVYCITNSH